MEKILILGAGEYQLPLIEKAKEMGLHTVVVSPDGDYPGLRTADKVYFYDVRDEKNILMIARKEKINGVVTDQTDLPVTTAAYIAEKLNICGIGYEVSKLFTNKYLMRECSNNIQGLSQVIYRPVYTIDEARTWSEKIGYPLIMKPVDNQGSRGVFKIYGYNDLEKYYKVTSQYSSDKSVLLEEFIDGYEVVIESAVYDELFDNLIIGDTDYFDLKYRFIPRQRLFPTEVNTEIKNKALELNEKIIRRFRLKKGITHGEFIVDKKTGKIYLLEIAARGGGVNISSHLITALTTLDTSEFLINIALDKKVDIKVQKKEDVTAGYIAFYLPPGRVIDIRGVDEIDRIEGVIRHNLFSIKKSQFTVPIEEKTSRKIINIKADNRSDILLLIEKIKSILKIAVRTKDGLKGIIWD